MRLLVEASFFLGTIGRETMRSGVPIPALLFFLKARFPIAIVG